MKKIGMLMMFGILVFGLISCDVPENEEIPEYDVFWESFYKSNTIKEKYAIPLDADTTKASYGYTLNDSQGHNNWYYLYANDLESTLQYEESISGFKNENVEIVNDEMKANDGIAVRGYKVSKPGKITICGNVSNVSDVNASFEIYKNDQKIYPIDGSLIIEANDTVGYYYEIETEVNNDDVIYFALLEGHIKCNPTISYVKINEILYQTPSWNFWGDVHPFYYNGKMYMYTLEGYLENPGNERYMWHLYTSTDMFTYEEEDYEVFPYVKNHYNDSLYVYESIFDKMTFPYGSRDMFLFYDEGAKKYIYFGLCYYEDMSSCLGVRVSDDETGVTWSTPMYSLRDFNFACDPECSQALYINDRWYIITSIWGQSIHSVGRPAYLIGDKGKNFLENDWSKKEFHYLDGEDLCAYNMVEVGAGHYLMYGWIPKTSYSNTEEVYFNGTRDHGLWGGNINVPREVYQNSDGTLSTRLDNQIVKLLNRGKIYYSDEITTKNGFVELGQFDRTYVEFDVEVNNSKYISYNLTSDGKNYEIRLTEETDGIYLSIVNLSDKGHKIASSMKIGNKLLDEYNFKILIDHSIFEVHVNDKYSLSARTSMFSGVHTSSLYSDNTAVFKNITVGKLAHQGDIYD